MTNVRYRDNSAEGTVGSIGVVVLAPLQSGPAALFARLSAPSTGSDLADRI